MKLLLKGGRVVDPASARDGEFDVLVDGDRIARIGRAVPAERRRDVSEFPRSAEFLDGVLASVRDALAALDRHDTGQTGLTSDPSRERTWATALGRLEGNLDGWEGMLGEMAEKVRSAQDDLTALDADLKRSLDAFAAARKHLQGA